jgi:predicted outer membrane repeat protein
MTDVLVQGNLDASNADVDHGGAGLANYAVGTAVLSDVTFRQNAILSPTYNYGGGGIANWGVLTMTGGLVTQNQSEYVGGGIYNEGGGGWPGRLSLTSVTVSGNSAAYGGGVFNYGGTAALTDGTLSGNSATEGGGIYNNGGTAALTHVTLSGNSATYGGGIGNYWGTATLTSVTLNGNSAGSKGGGIYNDTFGQASLTNVTLSGNSATDTGGGINNSGTTALTNVTLSGNSAASGAGIYNAAEYTVTLKNSIIAYSPKGGNCGGGALTSDKYSLSSDNTCALTGTGSRNNIDPVLTALGNYGGPTPVHMLKAGSLGINGVVGSDAPATDQRGKARPQGGAYDIGAVERQPGDSDLVPRVYLPVVIR